MKTNEEWLDALIEAANKLAQFEALGMNKGLDSTPLKIDLANVKKAVLERMLKQEEVLPSTEGEPLATTKQQTEELPGGVLAGKALVPGTDVGGNGDCGLA